MAVRFAYALGDPIGDGYGRAGKEPLAFETSPLSFEPLRVGDAIEKQVVTCSACMKLKYRRTTPSIMIRHDDHLRRDADGAQPKCDHLGIR